MCPARVFPSISRHDAASSTSRQGKTEGPEHLKSAPAIVDATAEVEEQGGQGGGQRGAEGGSAAEAAEVAVLRGIQAHERPIRDRVSVLRCPRKSLSKVLDQAVRVGLASQEAR